jgi:hypothetical protein
MLLLERCVAHRAGGAGDLPDVARGLRLHQVLPRGSDGGRVESLPIVENARGQPHHNVVADDVTALAVDENRVAREEAMRAEIDGVRPDFGAPRRTADMG